MTTVYDLIPDWGSYVADVEANLEMDPETWEDYLENPRPYLEDLLSDFGTFPDGVDIDTAIKTALDKAGYR